MSDIEEDQESIAWPGFVDILSSVIIMFVFFLLVVASALYFHILIFKSQVLSEESISAMSQSKMQELATTNRFLTEKIEELEEDMKLLEEISEENEIQLFKQDAEFAESETQTVTANPEDDSILVFFDKNSISVTLANQEVLDTEIGKYIARYGAQNIKATITSSKSPGAINDVIARRLAVARLLNVRNSFLKTEIPPANIKPVVKVGEPVDESYNWVRIQFEIPR